ncbi:helix-turn-helix domain-containing protein [Vibrio parahaemolyticus]|nr:helix-turn-helix domain-containing protein [Vibrio parahaemolyticus]
MNIYTPQQIQKAYEDSGSISVMAKTLGISYPTAHNWLHELKIKTRPVGYQTPHYKVSGTQVRQAREDLGFTRKVFSKHANVSETSLAQFERGNSSVRPSTMQKLIQYFALCGVSFNEDGTYSK